MEINLGKFYRPYTEKHGKITGDWRMDHKSEWIRPVEKSTLSS